MNRRFPQLCAATVFAAALANVPVVPAQAQTFLGASYYGGAVDQKATGVAVGSDGVYISGYAGNQQQSIAAKYALSPGASPIWATLWPTSSSPYESFNGVTATANGVYYAGASYSQTTDNIGGKEGKSVLVNFSTSGPTGLGVGGANWVATPSFFPGYQGGEGLNAVTNTVESGHTYLYAAGTGQANFSNDTAVLTKYDTTGAQQWQVAIGDTSAGRGGDAAGVTSLNGNIYVAGAQTSLSAASSSAMLWKYDTAGNAIWSTSYAGVNGAFANAIAAQGTGIFVTGALYNGPNGGEDLFVRRYDESGDLVWSDIWGGSADDIGNGITISGGNVYVVGTTASYGAGGTDALLLNINAATGVIDNTLLFGGALDDGAAAVAVSGNDLYVAGDTRSFGNNTGQDDAMLLHYSLAPTATPEPGPIAFVMTLGLSAIAFRRRFRRRVSDRVVTPQVDCKRRMFGRGVLGGVLCLIGATSLPGHAQTITLQSDGTTLAAALGPGAPSGAVVTLLDTGNTSGLTFGTALVGGFGSFTQVPSGAPVGTSVINIPPGDGENGFFETTFTLPANFSGASITGAANVDDFGRAFLNGNPISPSLSSGSPDLINEYNSTAFSTNTSSYFQSGQNVLLIADDNSGGGPSGAAFYATVTFNSISSVPEPGVVGLLLGMITVGAGILCKRRRTATPTSAHRNLKPRAVPLRSLC